MIKHYMNQTQIDQAFKEIVDRNNRFIYYTIKPYVGINKIESDDLLQLAYEGFYQAIMAFDDKKQFKLTTFAKRVIQNHISNYLKKEIYLLPISKHNHQKFNERDEAHLLPYVSNSLDDIRDDYVEPRINQIADEDTPEIRYMIYERNKYLRNLIDNHLSLKDIHIIESYFGFNHKAEQSYQQIASCLGLTKASIGKRLKASLNRLRDLMIQDQENVSVYQL